MTVKSIDNSQSNPKSEQNNSTKRLCSASPEESAIVSEVVKIKEMASQPL